MCFDTVGRRAIPGALFILVLLSSCTIREERTGCPCLLTVRFEDLPPGELFYRIDLASGDSYAAGTVNCDTSLVFRVPRDGVRLWAYSGEGMVPDGIRILYGNDCPAAFLYSSRVDTNHEAVIVNARPSKHFCTVKLELKGPLGEGRELDFTVRGEVEGFGFDGLPRPGRFACSLKGGSCRLPRQSPSDKLLLDIVSADGIVRTFALGNYIREIQYDWTEDNLKDITLELALSVTELNLTQQEWSETISAKVEI